MKKKILSIFFVILCIVGCNKEDNLPPEPLMPKLSMNSVSVEEGKSVEVTISSGKLPYSATVSPSGIVITTVEGSELTITGVKAGSATVVVKGVDGGSVSLPVVVTAPPDPLATFKDNPTPRWEFVRGETVSSTDPLYTFIIDKGTLFSSSQNKWGYASNDGNTFRLIEWGTSPILRTESGTVTVSSFRIVKEEQRTIWITFFANDTEYRVVVEKIQI